MSKGAALSRILQLHICTAWWYFHPQCRDLYILSSWSNSNLLDVSFETDCRMLNARIAVLNTKLLSEAQIMSSLTAAARGRVLNIFTTRVFEGRGKTRLCQEIVANGIALTVLSCWNLAATTCRYIALFCSHEDQVKYVLV